MACGCRTFFVASYQSQDGPTRKPFHRVRVGLNAFHIGPNAIDANIMLNNPSTIGIRRSIGFGDWLELATPGQVAALRPFPEVSAFFVQHASEAWDRPGTAPEAIIKSTGAVVAASGYERPWGADAGRLTSAEDIHAALAAGFTHLTLDVSGSVESYADLLDEATLRERASKLEAEGAFDGFGWKDYYIGRFFSVGHRINPIQFDEEDLLRAAVKYSRATMLAEQLGNTAAAAGAGRPYEVEISVAGSAAVTSTLDHLFLALELQRRGVPGLVALGLHYEGEFVPGIDFQGDTRRFEDRLRIHAGIAKFAGPYKLSFHHAADKFVLYPLMGRICGNMLHLKTATTSYLEALRVVVRTDAPLFAEIVAHSRECFANPAVAARTVLTAHQLSLLAPTGSAGDEDTYLDHLGGRQLLAAAAHSVLGETVPGLRERLRETVSRHSDLYTEILERHFLRHLSMLSAG